MRREPVWSPQTNPGAWRAAWQYSHKRATGDLKTLTLQEQRALEIIAGHRPAKKTRFVKTVGQHATLDETSLERTKQLVELKGYVTNITAETMPAAEIIASYHDLWHVEQSFRMSKNDLAARPIFHHRREAIEAHLTIVFTALAIARDLQARTGLSLEKISSKPSNHSDTSPSPSATTRSKPNPPSTPKQPNSSTLKGTKHVQLRSEWQL